MPDIALPALSDMVELLPPAGAALALVFAGAWIGREGRERWFAAACVLAIGVAYVWTFVRLRDWPAFPPRQSTERGFFAVLSAVALALLPAVRPSSRRALLHGMSASACVLLVAGGLGSENLHGWRLMVVVLGATSASLLFDLASFCPTPVFAFACSAAFGAMGQVFVMYHSALLGQLAGALAITMGLVSASSFNFRRHVPAPAALPLAAIFAALAIDSEMFSYQSPPVLALVCFAAAPLAPLLVYWSAAGRLGVWKSMGLSVLLALSVAGAGFYVAWRVAPPAGW